MIDLQVTIIHCGNAITEVHFGSGEQIASPLAETAAAQLREYTEGQRTKFDLPLAPKGTDFQLAVWEALLQIPYGQTRSYGEIAEMIGKPKAARAVGLACNRNPLPILIPCHRVVGKDRKLTGYAGGMDLKQQLLDLERDTYERTFE